MQSPKIWIKPVIEVTQIKLAEFYNVNRTDQGGAQHQS